MKITAPSNPDIQKFIKSQYGEKLLLVAKLNGKEFFTYMKKTYSINQLLGYINENRKIESNPTA